MTTSGYGWLYKYGRPVVWHTSSGLPYTARQIVNRYKRAVDEPLELPDIRTSIEAVGDGIYRVTVEGVYEDVPAEDVDAALTRLLEQVAGV